ncbi:MAG: hypothetical protein WBS24_16320 [Terriglobales bacterium]
MIVHVYRDWAKPFAKPLRQADLQFGLTKPHLRSGKNVMIATIEGHSLGFTHVLGQLDQDQPALLVLDTERDIPNDATRQELGSPIFVCGGHPAYIANWVTGEQREAATMYLAYVSAHCGTESAK